MLSSKRKDFGGQTVGCGSRHPPCPSDVSTVHTTLGVVVGLLPVSSTDLFDLSCPNVRILTPLIVPLHTMQSYITRDRGLRSRNSWLVSSHLPTHFDTRLLKGCLQKEMSLKESQRQDQQQQNN